MTTKFAKLTQVERESIIFAVTHHGISTRDVADMYLTSHTTAQRLVKDYKNFPEKYPGVKQMQEDAMYADRDIEHIVLSTPPLQIVDEGRVIDLGGVARKNRANEERSSVEHEANQTFLVVVALVLAVAVVGTILGWSIWQ